MKSISGDVAAFRRMQLKNAGGGKLGSKGPEASAGVPAKKGKQLPQESHGNRRALAGLIPRRGASRRLRAPTVRGGEPFSLCAATHSPRARRDRAERDRNA